MIDDLCRAEHVTPVYETVNEELSVNSRETGKEASKTSVVGPDPYCKSCNPRINGSV